MAAALQIDGTRLALPVLRRRYAMKAGLEPLLRDATIKAIDGVSRKAGKLESKAGKAANRLLKRWNGLSRQEKENVAGIVIATATTVVTAIVAMKGKRKKGFGRIAGNARSALDCGALAPLSNPTLSDEKSARDESGGKPPQSKAASPLRAGEGTTGPD